LNAFLIAYLHNLRRRRRRHDLLQLKKNDKFAVSQFSELFNWELFKSLEDSKVVNRKVLIFSQVLN